MDLMNLVLRFGTVGGTARWAAKHYLRLKKGNLTDVEVMRNMVEFRYEIFKNEDIKKKLLDRLANIDNLTDLTFSILQLEGAIKTSEAPMHLTMQITAAIMKELSKKGVPEKAIMGHKVF